MSDYITELDVLDPVVAEFSAWVYCEECGDVATTMDMVRQHDGGWLCGACHWGYMREHEAHRQYLAGIRWS